MRADMKCVSPGVCDRLTGSLNAQETFQLLGEGFNAKLANSSFCVFAEKTGNLGQAVRTPVVKIVSPQQVTCKAPIWRYPALEAIISYSYGGNLIASSPPLIYEFLPELQNIVELTVLRLSSKFDWPDYQAKLATALGVAQSQISPLSNVSEASRRNLRTEAALKVFNISIIDSATQSGMDNINKLRNLSYSNAVILRELQIVLVRFFESDGTPIVYNNTGTCPGPLRPLANPCYGNGMCVGNGSTEMKTCECAPAFGMKDCRPLPMVLDVCIGNVSDTCAKELFVQYGPVPMAVSVRVGNLPPPEADEDRKVTCVFSLDAAEPPQPSVEIPGTISGTSLVACHLEQVSRVCNSDSLGRWTVNIKLSERYDSYSTAASTIKFRDLVIPCYGEIASLKVCANSGFQTLEDSTQVARSTEAPFDCAKDFSASFGAGGNQVTLNVLRVEVSN
jgi:hypothetical protein